MEPVFAIGDADVPSWLFDMQRLYETSTGDSRKGQRLNDFRRALAAVRRGEAPPTRTPSVLPVVNIDERLAKLSDLLADLSA